MIQKYIWITPYLFEIAFGIPTKKSLKSDVSRILQGLDRAENYAIIRLAIEYCFGKNNVGKELYTKLFSTFTQPETLKKRWKSFENMVDGYDGDFNNIKITREMGMIMDGAHRLMISQYYGKKELLFDVYECSKYEFLKWSGNSTMIVELEKIFSHQEILLIRDAYERMMQNV